MRFLGFEITRVKKNLPPLMPPMSSSGAGGWWPVVRESFPGAWQRNIEVRADWVLNYWAVYACLTMISDDISKMELCLKVRQGIDGIADDTFSAAFSPVLRKPNHFQNRIQFIKQWVLSKLIHGNTYVLKQRDQRGIVVSLYILDPYRVKPLVAPDGSVFYSVNIDYLAGINPEQNPDQTTENLSAVPASEIIHDVNSPLWHPLIGVSPIFAAGLPAMHGLNIEQNAAKFFQSGSFPGGILTSPNEISDDQAKDFKTYWDNNFTGNNAGKVAVLSGGLTYTPLVVNAVDAQLIEQLRWTAEAICACFKVPAFLLGVGAAPTRAYANVEAINQQYYSQCLQAHMESIELGLEEGLALPQSASGTGQSYEIEFELNDLLRMDTATKVKSWGDLIHAGIASPNEARSDFDLDPVQGGDTPYLQQQNFSLAALDKRDSSADPFGIARTPSSSRTPSDGGDGPGAQDTGSADAAAAADQAMAKMIRSIDHRILS